MCRNRQQLKEHHGMEHVMEPDDGEGIDPPQDAAAVVPREPWEKKADESLKAYDAFSAYRDSEKRSLKAIADSLNCSVQNVHWWSMRHNWKLRCDAFDLDQDRQQREDFARNRTKMRERHLSVAGAMLGVAAHGLREWQSRIASGSALNLAPEQIAMLTKCAIEIERTTTGEDGEGHRPTTINILFGTHKYSGEKAGDSGEVEGEVEWRSQEAVDREQYEKLDDEGRRSWRTWKNPPPKLTN
jgi:hypothetical protein